MKTLVAYFSAEGNTRRFAQSMARRLGADLFEIKPQRPYIKSDINWTNPLSRCNREKLGRKDVPVTGEVKDFASYDTVLLGFPIWYGSAPNVVNTFCKGYDWSGKRVYLFATSGGSGMGKTAERLAPYVEGAKVAGERLLRGPADVDGLLADIG